MAENDVDNELLDYEEDEEPQGAPESATPAGKKEVKGSYVSIHSSGFRDFLLKPELLRAIIDCGFEHPSEGELHLMLVLVKMVGVIFTGFLVGLNNKLDHFNFINDVAAPALSY